PTLRVMRSPHTPAYIAFITRLVAARRAAGLSQGEVASLVKIPQSRFSRMESGERRVDVRKNIALVANVGATPYIALRSNASPTAVSTYASPKAKPDSMAWRWLYHLYSLRADEFFTHYHQRSNIESTFSSMKRVFGDTLRSKTSEAQINELLLKVIAYNIVCVVHSIFELGVSVPGIETAA
ncbi:MAG: transposase, partial [Gemmatimonadaceae bacterium]